MKGEQSKDKVREIMKNKNDRQNEKKEKKGKEE